MFDHYVATLPEPLSEELLELCLRVLNVFPNSAHSLEAVMRILVMVTRSHGCAKRFFESGVSYRRGRASSAVLTALVACRD